MIKKVKIELKNVFLKLDKNHIFKNFSLDFSTEGISLFWELMVPVKLF